MPGLPALNNVNFSIGILFFEVLLTRGLIRLFHKFPLNFNGFPQSQLISIEFELVSIKVIFTFGDLLAGGITNGGRWPKEQSIIDHLIMVMF